MQVILSSCTLVVFYVSILVLFLASSASISICLNLILTSCEQLPNLNNSNQLHGCHSSCDLVTSGTWQVINGSALHHLPGPFMAGLCDKSITLYHFWLWLYNVVPYGIKKLHVLLVLCICFKDNVRILYSYVLCCSWFCFCTQRSSVCTGKKLFTFSFTFMYS